MVICMDTWLEEMNLQVFFTAADKIRSSPAVGDVDNDGSNELVFGSHDGGLHSLV